MFNGLTMASSNETFIKNEDKEFLLQRYLDIEWSDDVTHLRCVRCDRVAISHYVSNCQHLFCRNCRVIFSDGGRWKCPQCHEYVTQLNDQDVEFESQLSTLRVHCLNKKYGCQHMDQLRYIVDHVRCCLDTKDASLPMEYTGKNTLDALYRCVSGLSKQMREMSDEMRVMKSENEANWKQIETKMTEMELKVDNRIDEFASDLKGLKTDLHMQKESLTNCEMHIRERDSANTPTIEMLRDEVEKMKVEQTRMSVKANEYSETIYTIKGRAETFFQLMEQKSEKQKSLIDQQEINLKAVMNQLMAELKTELTSKMELNEASVRKAVDEMDDRTKGRIETTADEITKIIHQYMQQLSNVESKLNDAEKKNEMATYKADDKLKIIDNRMTTMQTLMGLMESRGCVNQSPMSEDVKSISEAYEWTITDFKGKSLSEWDSEVFPLPGYQFSAKAKVKLSGPTQLKFMFVSLQLTENNATKQPSDVKPFPKLTYIIKDQCDKGHKRDIVRTLHSHFNRPLKYEQEIFSEIFWLSDDYSTGNYIADNCMKIVVLVEPPSMARSYFSNNGVLNWRVDNYSERKRMEEDQLVDFHESPHFYTGPQGYRVQILLYLIKFSTVKAKLLFLTGEFDSFLTDQFPHRVTLTVCNQEDPSKNLVVSQNGSLAYYTDVNIEDSSSLECGGYVKNDSLLLKAVVEPV